jgi:hypothetical protein
VRDFCNPNNPPLPAGSPALELVTSICAKQKKFVSFYAEEHKKNDYKRESNGAEVGTTFARAILGAGKPCMMGVRGFEGAALTRLELALFMHSSGGRPDVNTLGTMLESGSSVGSFAGQPVPAAASTAVFALGAHVRDHDFRSSLNASRSTSGPPVVTLGTIGYMHCNPALGGPLVPACAAPSQALVPAAVGTAEWEKSRRECAADPTARDWVSRLQGKIEGFVNGTCTSQLPKWLDGACATARELNSPANRHLLTCSPPPTKAVPRKSAGLTL